MAFSKDFEIGRFTTVIKVKTFFLSISWLLIKSEETYLVKPMKSLAIQGS